MQNWWEFPWGANWCARRKALLEIGGFRGRYGRRGNDYSGGEEIIAAALIQKLGYSIALLPSAVVFHQVDPDRFTLDHVKRTIRAAAIIHYQSQLDLYFPFDLKVGLGNKVLQSLGTIFKLQKSSTQKITPLEKKYQRSTRVTLATHIIKDELKRISYIFRRS